MKKIGQINKLYKILAKLWEKNHKICLKKHCHNLIFSLNTTNLCFKLSKHAELCVV